MYFNNDEVAAAFPAKVKICALQRGSEAKEFCTFPEKLIFNLQHLYLPQWISSSCLIWVQASALGEEGAPGTEVQHKNESRPEAGGAMRTSTCTEQPRGNYAVHRPCHHEESCLPRPSSCPPVSPVLHLWDSYLLLSCSSFVPWASSIKGTCVIFTRSNAHPLLLEPWRSLMVRGWVQAKVTLVFI